MTTSHMRSARGIDINAFPAQLSSINLAVRNLRVTSRNINVTVSDFFKVKQSMKIIPSELDAVVTNPPYTRQEEMDFKDQIRKEALTYSDGSQVNINAQAGIYAYFFTHSAKFSARVIQFFAQFEVAAFIKVNVVFICLHNYITASNFLRQRNRKA